MPIDTYQSREKLFIECPLTKAKECIVNAKKTTKKKKTNHMDITRAQSGGYWCVYKNSYSHHQNLYLRKRKKMKNYDIQMNKKKTLKLEDRRPKISKVSIRRFENRLWVCVNWCVFIYHLVDTCVDAILCVCVCREILWFPTHANTSTIVEKKNLKMIFLNILFFLYIFIWRRNRQWNNSRTFHHIECFHFFFCLIFKLCFHFKWENSRDRGMFPFSFFVHIASSVLWSNKYRPFHGNKHQSDRKYERFICCCFCGIKWKICFNLTFVYIFSFGRCR